MVSHFTISHQRSSGRNGDLRNFAKFAEKHLCQSLCFNKISDLRPATLLKMRHWHRCFPVNFVKFLKTPFFQNTSGRLLQIFGSLRHFITKCDKEGRTRNQILVTERLTFRLNRVEAKPNSFSKSFS